LFGLAIWLTLLGLSSACHKMPYVPGEDAVIYLQASSALINLGERALIFIRGEKGNGYSLPDGTIVYLSASRGTLPAEVALQDGKATAEFQADEQFSGDVEIKARSGQGKIIPESLIITVADRVVDSLSIWAEPTQLPYGGGQSRIEVLALDALQKPVPEKIVFISTSAGTLSGGGARTTDANGKIRAYLKTEKAAVVTAKYKNLECSVSIEIASQNINPVADFFFTPLEPKSGETVYFNASASYDTDGHIVSYEWEFGDGASGSGETVGHAYSFAKTRSYMVLLKVTDNAGAEGVKTKQITSQNSKPVADFVFSPLEPKSGETVYFNASTSYDSDGQIVSYIWDFGDGTSDSGVTTSHTYTVSATRSFVVVLKVVDDGGAESAKAKNIEIKAVP
jgi:PKD repeat protein